MNIKKFKKLKSKIKTYKAWFSSGLFGFHGLYDVNIYDLASNKEPKPEAIIYGLSIEDALRRYMKKRPWRDALRCSRENGKMFARAVVLSNHGLHLKPCNWSLNLPRDISFWD